MRICGMHIDGFGLFHNLDLPDLPTGLGIFAGDNESGKTTLMQFIRMVLFGFPTRRREYNDYPPLRGGNHGGRLLVEMQDGRRIRIERVGKQATIAHENGAAEPGDPSALLLGGIDQKTFQRIFAIGLTDLQRLDILSQVGVRARLFAASAGLGCVPLPQVQATLDKQCDELLKARGQGRINNLLRDLRETRDQIKSLQGESTEYASLQSARIELEAQIRDQRASEEVLRRRLKRLDQLARAREPWLSLEGARRRLPDLEVARSFPPQGLDRLDRLKVEIEEATGKQTSAAGEAERLERELEGIKVDDSILADAEDIESLAAERERLRSALEDRPARESEVSQARDDLIRRLRELGPEWTVEQAEEVDTSVQVRQEVQEIGRRLLAAERRHDEVQFALEPARKALQESATDLEAIEGQIAGLPVLPPEQTRNLDAQRKAIPRLRLLLQQFEVLRMHLEERRRAEEDATQRSRLLAEAPAPAPALPRGLIWAAPAVLVVLAILAAVQSSWIVAGMLLVLAPFLVAWLRHTRQQTEARDAARHAKWEQDKALAEQAAQDATQEVADLELQISDQQEKLRQLAEAEGLAVPSDLSALETQASALDDIVEQLRARGALEHDRAEAEKRTLRARETEQSLVKQEAQAQDALKHVRDEWQAWLSQRGFASVLRPDGYEAVMQAVELARQAARTLGERSKRLDTLEAYLSQTRSRLREALTACGCTPSSAVGIAEIDALRRNLQEAKEALDRKLRLEIQSTQARDGMEQWAQVLRKKQEELASLLGSGETSDEETFRRLAETHNALLGCEETIERNELALAAIVGTTEAVANLEEELLAADEMALSAEHEQLTVDLGTLQAAISEAEQTRGGYTQRIVVMDNDVRLSSLLLQEQGLEQQVRDAVKSWAALSVCRHFLGATQDAYERERQPQVVRDASGFVETLTGGRYSLIAPLGGSEVQLQEPSLARKTEVQWSGGLADQVYLSMRLALARGFGQHAEPLPVILDDVLVEFDPTRRLAAARVILDFAREQQVLMFSCYPETLVAIRTAVHDAAGDAPATTRYDVSDGVVSSALSL